MIRAGLFLYDHLARRELLPGSGRIDLQNHRAGSALKEGYSTGFVYSDARVDDARLVVSCALDAAARGARIFTRTRCQAAVRQNGYWHARLERRDGEVLNARARCLVNAAGPWVAQFQHLVDPGRHERPIRLDKGSHIVVKKLFDHPYAYIFQHTDGRIVFAIPYERDFTLIGTTDVEFHGDPDRVEIDEQEIAYLCELCGRYFRQPVTPADVIWAYSGVRPLVEDAAADPSAVTRDYHLELDDEGAPILSIFGGKVTTFRKLAEEVVDHLAPLLRPPRPAAWTAYACLPGGDFAGERASNQSVLSFADYLARALQAYPWLPRDLGERYFRAYGTRIHLLLNDCRAMADLGRELLPGLFEAEAKYWMRYEWAHTAADMLWRRSKLGLHTSAQGEALLDSWIAAQR
jgi:glycerol-3-phosphate dehydrogenase